MQVGDVLAIKGAKLTEFRENRSVSSALLTYLDRNPVPNDAYERPEPINADSPTKRALTMKTGEPLPFAEVKTLLQQIRSYDSEMLPAPSQDSRWTVGPTDLRFTVRAKIQPFNDDIFKQGVPFFGPDANQKMRFTVTLEDASGAYLRGVTLWSEAAREVTQLDVETAVGMWEACETPEGRKAFLTALNANLGNSFDFNCSVKAGDDGSQKGTRINANNAELVGAQDS